MNRNHHNQIRVLLLMANPKDRLWLNLDEEVRQIKAKLNEQGCADRFEFQYNYATRPGDILTAIAQFRPQVVHFSGHGSKQGELYFQGNDGKSAIVSEEALTDFFQLACRDVECVLLNACHSQQQARAIANHITYVIGMGKSISDTAAISFSSAFYAALATDLKYQNAYEWGRLAIKLNNNDEASVPRFYCCDRVFHAARPSIEDTCYREIIKPGALIRIKAPQGMGKTRLMRSIIENVRSQHNYEAVAINFHSLLYSRKQYDIVDLLKIFCSKVQKDLSISTSIHEVWDDLNTPIENVEEYFQKYILSKLTQPLILALNCVDVIFERPELADDFCQMLRNWHLLSRQGGRKEETWQKLRLVIVHATEIYTNFNINSSPLANVGLPINLDDLSIEEVKRWFSHEDLTFHEDDFEKIIKLIGGHPYLVQRTIFYFQQYKISVEEFLNVAVSSITPSAPFRGYLRDLLESVCHYEDLKKGLKAIINHGYGELVAIDPNIACKLYNLGLLRYQGNLVKIRCNLYYLFFRNNL